MINANLCRRSDFTLKILLVVFVVTIIGATIGLKFVRSENKIVCMWLVPIGCLGGIFALMMFPSITTNDLLLGKRWSEDCRVVEKYERHAFEAPTNRLICSGLMSMLIQKVMRY
jgi:hypothetical protein